MSLVSNDLAESQGRRSSRLPVVGAIIALLIAVTLLLSAIQAPVLALFALVPLLAAIGLFRKRIWSAYGFALFALAQLLITPLLLIRNGNFPVAQIVVTIVLNTGVVLLFFFAGRALAASGARRGSALLWILISCFFALPFLFFEPFLILTGGMEDTLLIRDHILVRVLPRVRPRFGDIVVFRYPIDRRQIFVKRVIGLPGDHIRMVNRILYRNGVALSEPYAVHKFNVIDNYRDNLPSDHGRIAILPGQREMRAAREMLQKNVTDGDVVIPAGKYFVLGDNRDNSLDSRYWGFLDASEIIGTPVLIYNSIEQPSGDSAAAKTLSIKRIRWTRLLKRL